MTLLLNEPPIVISPSLASILGLKEAVFLQQLHYWLEEKRRNPAKYADSHLNGHYWVYNSVSDWLNKMPFLGSEKTFRRMQTELKNMNIIVTEEFHRKRGDCTPFYRINYSVLNELMTRVGGQNDQGGVANLARVGGQSDQAFIGTKTTTEITTETTTTLPQQGPGSDHGGKAFASEPEPQVITPAVIMLSANAPQMGTTSPNPQSLNPGTPPGSATPPQLAKPDEARALIDELVNWGVQYWQAENLVMSFDHRQIRQQMDWMPERGNIRLPGDFLTRAIRQNYAAPRQAQQQHQAQEQVYEQIQEQTSAKAEFTVFIEALNIGSRLVSQSGKRYSVEYIDPSKQYARVVLDGTRQDLNVTFQNFHLLSKEANR